MMFSEHLKMALTSIKAARFRSFLTMLGIIIGVVSVITIASLGEGVKRQIAGQNGSADSSLITIRPGKLVNRDDEGNVEKLNLLGFLSSSVISEKDLESVKNTEGVQKAVPLSVISGIPSIGGDKYDEAFIMATTNELPELSTQKVEFGDFFSESDKDRRVAIIGKSVAEELFKENVPISKSMTIRGQEFVVSGVLERMPANPLGPEADYNNAIFIPYNAGKSVAGTDLKIYEILVRPDSREQTEIDQTMGRITEQLRKNHGGEEDFTVLRQKDIVAVADNLVRLVTTSVAVMAAIALFVGGIGIMNVMLVSVTERTREIGIRKAVGATNSQIRRQFLIEAAVISGLGAIIGILLSFFINMLFLIFTYLKPVITWEIAALVSLAAITVGIVFGMIPAIKASRKDPIEALRTS